MVDAKVADGDMVKASTVDTKAKWESIAEEDRHMIVRAAHAGVELAPTGADGKPVDPDHCPTCGGEMAVQPNANDGCVPGDCWKDARNCGACYTCLDNPSLGLQNPVLQRMILCPLCGNKRCPKATDHTLTCTRSNDPDQPGSRYSETPVGTRPASVPPETIPTTDPPDPPEGDMLMAAGLGMANPVGQDTLPETIAKMHEVVGALALLGYTRLSKHIAEATMGLEHGGMGGNGSSEPSSAAAINEAANVTAQAARVWSELAPNLKIPAGYEGTFNELIAPVTERFTAAAKSLAVASRVTGMIAEVAVSRAEENLRLRAEVKDLRAKLGVSVPPPHGPWELRGSEPNREVHVCSRCRVMRETFRSGYSELPPTVHYLPAIGAAREVREQAWGQVGFVFEDPGCLPAESSTSTEPSHG